MTILVAGGDRVDAGKTTFAVGLVSYLDAIGFKPRAGNDYWFDHDDYLAAVREGRLYGKDARRLADASAADVTPEEINPVHRLWRPAPDGDEFIGGSHRTFVLDRVGDSYVVNGRGTVPPSAREALSLDDAPVVRTVDELNTEITSRHLPQLDALRERVREAHTAVVESYGDVARPLRSLEVERVAVVEPERARFYDGERYGKACDVAAGSPHEGQLEERVTDVEELLDPERIVDLPPLSNETRKAPAGIAERYADAYELLTARPSTG